MEHGSRIWHEDDATMHIGDPGHEGAHQAWERIFGEKLDLKKAVEVEDPDFEPAYRMPSGIVIFLCCDGAVFFNPPGK